MWRQIAGIQKSGRGRRVAALKERMNRVVGRGPAVARVKKTSPASRHCMRSVHRASDRAANARGRSLVSPGLTPTAAIVSQSPRPPPPSLPGLRHSSSSSSSRSAGQEISSSRTESLSSIATSNGGRVASGKVAAGLERFASQVEGGGGLGGDEEENDVDDESYDDA
jgi:hypothetical protein